MDDVVTDCDSRSQPCVAVKATSEILTVVQKESGSVRLQVALDEVELVLLLDTLNDLLDRPRPVLVCPAKGMLSHLLSHTRKRDPYPITAR